MPTLLEMAMITGVFLPLKGKATLKLRRLATLTPEELEYRKALDRHYNQKGYACRKPEKQKEYNQRYYSLNREHHIQVVTLAKKKAKETLQKWDYN